VKQLRRIHLYLGCFITPLLIVYLVSGFYFIFSPERQKDDGEAQTLMQKLYWMHTDQQLPRGASGMIDPEAKPQPKTITTYEADTALFKFLVYVMVIGAVCTMILGIVLAIRTTKEKAPVIGSIIAGILIPLIFLWVGQRKVEKANPFHPDSQEKIPGPGITPLPLPPDNNDGSTPSILPTGKPKQ
tara:strand:- start:90 stop:647 length:558 start_codon:yes stop_codon:yes gene_type:complete